MFIVGILSWWYGTGWKQRFLMLRERLAATADYFSIDLLLKTLFAPYRQISAGQVQGALNVQMRAFFDRLLSRIIGAVIRTFMIVFGLLSLLFYLVIGLFLVILWGVVPLLPILGVILFVTGWLPWKM
ncbi:MAG TPA: hypothetical protein VFT59_04850 [Candidatus Saccharimonadales bacterium]|nr:hypothetical protein [Candidatus Saccharimonadales bacterium]